MAATAVATTATATIAAACHVRPVRPDEDDGEYHPNDAKYEALYAMRR
jgi:hypothetical protein